MTQAAHDFKALAAANPGVWLETFGKIRNPAGKLETPKMNVLQRRINALFVASRTQKKVCRGVGLKPRKRGFSTMVSAIHYADLNQFAHEGVIIGNKLETSEAVFAMMRLYAENDGFKSQWGSGYKATTETMKWQHGAKLAMSTANNADSIRGQTPHCCHGTEVAHWENEEEVFIALMNAIPDDPMTTVFLESTPKGISGSFARIWNEARWPRDDECPPGQEGYWRYWQALCPDQETGVFTEFEFVRVFAAWFEFEDARLKMLTEAEKEEVRASLDAKSWYYGERALIEAYGNERADGTRRLGLEVEDCDLWQQLAWRRMIIKTKCDSDPRKFDQEYPRDPRSCFLASGNPVFDGDAIAHLQSMTGAPRDYGTLQAAGERAVWNATAPESALFWRWEAPKLGLHYLIVLDPAEGHDQSTGDDPDRHSALVLRRAYRDAAGVFYKTRVVARIAPPCRVPLHALIEWVDILSRYYGRCIVVPEMNNSGLAYITGAQLIGTPIWKRIEFNNRTGKKEEKYGWRTTDVADYGGIRTVIINNLHRILRDCELESHCPNIVAELMAFVNKKGRMEAEHGAHDDDVLALSIGLYNIDAASAYQELAYRRVPPKDLQDLMGDREQGGMAMKW